MRAAPRVILRVTKRSGRSGDSWLKSNPEQAKKLLQLAEEDVGSRWKLYENWAAVAPAILSPVSLPTETTK